MTVSCGCCATAQANQPELTMLQRSMTIDTPVGAALSDPELLLEVRRLAGQERQATARLIAALGELDSRRLYLGQGCSSLFTFCTQVLRLSEHAAYGRIAAARAAVRFPVILEMLLDGSVTLTTVGLAHRAFDAWESSRFAGGHTVQDQTRGRTSRCRFSSVAGSATIGSQAA